MHTGRVRLIKGIFSKGFPIPYFSSLSSDVLWLQPDYEFRFHFIKDIFCFFPIALRKTSASPLRNQFFGIKASPVLDKR
jgi:hypothetical protein